ncbi:MAG: TrmB family transcriptional regulator [Candidatus Woesearchaeota archaeon]
MNIEKLTETLKELNLSDKEARIYLNLLRLDQTTVTRLAKESELNRITTYHIINSLTTKGLITMTLKDNIQNFQAVDPKRLLAILNEKKEKISQIIPELEILKNSAGEKPSVELYEGPKGIAALMDKTLNSGNSILSYGNYSIAKMALQYQSSNFRKRRIEKKITLKAVIDNFDKEFIKLKGWDKLTKIRLLNSLKKTSVFVHICGDIVAIYTFNKELIGISIQSKEVVKMHEFFFNLLWNQAKE